MSDPKSEKDREVRLHGHDAAGNKQLYILHNAKFLSFIFFGPTIITFDSVPNSGFYLQNGLLRSESFSLERRLMFNLDEESKGRSARSIQQPGRRPFEFRTYNLQYRVGRQSIA